MGNVLWPSQPERMQPAQSEVFFLSSMCWSPRLITTSMSFEVLLNGLNLAARAKSRAALLDNAISEICRTEG